MVLWLELASRLGGLDELAAWGPFAVLGLLALLALAALARAPGGDEAAWTLAAVLAVSPLLVFYGRTARPYGVAAPLAVIAVVALARWWRDGGRASAALFVLGATLAGWAMPVYLPFVLAPPLALLAAALTAAPAARPRARRRAFRLALLAGATLVLLAVALAPPLAGDSGALLGKANAPLPHAATLAHAARLAAGLGWFAGLLAAVALAAAGIAFLLGRGERALVAALGAGAAGEVAALLVVRPTGFHDSAFVAARYLLPVALSLLFAAAIGAAELARRRAAGRWLLAALLLALAGARWAPALPLLADRTDDFRSARLYHLLFFPPGRLLAEFARLPAAYAAFAGAGDGAIVEVPYDGIHRTPYPYYQHRHGREVFVAVAPRECGYGEPEGLPADGEDGFRLSRLVSLEAPGALAARGVRWLVVHRDVEAEVPWTPPARLRPGGWGGWAECVAEIARVTGRAPLTRDGIAVFDLAAPAAP